MGLAQMVVPLSYFIERPFQNWTRDTQSLIGAIAFHVDYCTDVSRIRQRLEEAVRETKLWDGAVVNLQVIEASPRAIELRALVSARSAPQSWDLRCEIREKLLAFIRLEMPEAFPRERAMISPPLADFEGAFARGDGPARPVPVRTHKLRSCNGQIPGSDARVANEAESALLPVVPAVMDTVAPLPEMHPEEEIDEPSDCPCR
jgi:hypothetical protein